MNIGEWLPVTATFSACFQNNHHHYPNLLRLSHADSEYDFGFITIRWLKALGVVTATPRGEFIPEDVKLSPAGFLRRGGSSGEERLDVWRMKPFGISSPERPYFSAHVSG